jgi:hypothetical protein
MAIWKSTISRRLGPFFRIPLGVWMYMCTFHYCIALYKVWHCYGNSVQNFFWFCFTTIVFKFKNVSLAFFVFHYSNNCTAYN